MPICSSYSQKITKLKNRTVINLDGIWDIDEGLMNEIPRRFGGQKSLSEDMFNIRTVQVPGLVDLSNPPLPTYGWNAKHREAFWYHRKFNIAPPFPDLIILKVNKARFGTEVFINGKSAGSHLPNFTPGYFDIRHLLNESGEANQLLIRIGAFPDSVPDNIVRGGDSEMVNFIPGIYDSVELIMSNSPHIVNIQTAPDIINQKVKIAVTIGNQKNNDTQTIVNYVIRECISGKEVACGQTSSVTVEKNSVVTINSEIKIDNCHLWSPEDPFLYELEADTGNDTALIRFGMRTFRFDKKTKTALLNEKPYYMRGANVCAHRFFEDPLRSNLPWDEQWVRKLHNQFRRMHWNSLRYTIGFPPEQWYQIADEVGFLIQDEFPLWYSSDEGLGKWPEMLKAENLAEEYKEWITERCNHPCVVIWNAANETRTEQTGNAIKMVKSMDLSNRPWGNSWGQWQDPDSCIDAHTYLFIDHIVNELPNVFKLSDLVNISPVPRRGVEADLVTQIPCDEDKPIFVNEYGWLWLNRDGTPTTLTEKLYNNILGPNASSDDRRLCCARIFAALTEFWRCHRKAAAIIGPFGLCHSRPDGRTCDHFIDIHTLEFEPYFQKYVGDSFSPIGIMLDEWNETLKAGQTRKINIYITNDTNKNWDGKVSFEFSGNGKTVFEYNQDCKIPAYKQEILKFEYTVPSETGKYKLIGSLQYVNSKPVHSVRDITIVK